MRNVSAYWGVRISGEVFIRGQINDWDMPALLRCPLFRGSTVVTGHKLLCNNTEGPGCIAIVEITCSLSLCVFVLSSMSYVAMSRNHSPLSLTPR